jgi:hypothetical protein
MDDIDLKLEKFFASYSMDMKFLIENISQSNKNSIIYSTIEQDKGLLTCQKELSPVLLNREYKAFDDLLVLPSPTKLIHQKQQQPQSMTNINNGDNVSTGSDSCNSPIKVNMTQAGSGGSSRKLLSNMSCSSINEEKLSELLLEDENKTIDRSSIQQTQSILVPIDSLISNVTIKASNSQFQNDEGTGTGTESNELTNEVIDDSEDYELNEEDEQDMNDYSSRYGNENDSLNTFESMSQNSRTVAVSMIDEQSCKGESQIADTAYTKPSESTLKAPIRPQQQRLTKKSGVYSSAAKRKTAKKAASKTTDGSKFRMRKYLMNAIRQGSKKSFSTSYPNQTQRNALEASESQTGESKLHKFKSDSELSATKNNEKQPHDGETRDSDHPIKSATIDEPNAAYVSNVKETGKNQNFFNFLKRSSNKIKAYKKSSVATASKRDSKSMDNNRSNLLGLSSKSDNINLNKIGKLKFDLNINELALLRRKSAKDDFDKKPETTEIRKQSESAIQKRESVPENNATAFLASTATATIANLAAPSAFSMYQSKSLSKLDKEQLSKTNQEISSSSFDFNSNLAVTSSKSSVKSLDKEKETSFK